MSEQKVFYEIGSVKIKDHFPTIEYTETIVTEVNGVEKRIPKQLSLNKSKFPAHKDFSNKLQALAIHFAILIDRIDQDTVNPDQLYQDAEDNLYESELLEGIEIRSVSISERKNIKCVIITGILTLKNGRKLTINTPLTELEETEAYRFGENLDIDISLLEEEAIKYLRGKYSVEQLSLNFSDGDDDEGEEEDETPENSADDLPFA